MADLLVGMSYPTATMSVLENKSVEPLATLMSTWVPVPVALLFLMMPPMPVSCTFTLDEAIFIRGLVNATLLVKL